MRLKSMLSVGGFVGRNSSGRTFSSLWRHFPIMAVILTVVAVTAELFSRLGLFSRRPEARHSDTPALKDYIKTREEEETEQSREEREEEEEEESAEKVYPHFLNTTEHVRFFLSAHPPPLGSVPVE